MSFDHELVTLLDKRSESLKELGVDRSEVVNAILDEFMDERGSDESVWDLVSKRRVKMRR